MNSKKITIVGGGTAGLMLARSLYGQKANTALNITVVEPRNYYEAVWALPRACFDKKVREMSIMPLDDPAFTTGASKPGPSGSTVTIRNGFVSSLAVGSVTLDDGTQIAHDICVIATGSTCPCLQVGTSGFARTRAERMKQIEEMGKTFDGKRVVILGGGLVGTELAAEALTQGSPVSVAVVHGAETLAMGGLARKAFGDLVQGIVKKHGASVFTNSHGTVVENNSRVKNVIIRSKADGSVTELEADLVIQATGVGARNAFCPSAALDSDGWVRVDEFGRVKGVEGAVFAFGDCSDQFGSQRSVMNLSMNIASLTSNIISTAQGAVGSRAKVSLKNTAAGPIGSLVVTTLGPNDGVAQTPLGSFRWILPAIKNRDLFVPYMKSSLVYK